jgi:DNA end-binding protein Ku
MRALWTGEIAFGLVSIPVKLYAATRDLAPRFHYVHKTCGTRIVTVRRCPHDNVDVPWQEIGKGYEVSKGQYALFTKEELEELEGEEAASGIDIAEFVGPNEVDLALVEKSYWVGPAGRSTKGYELLREVLEGSGRVAIARVRIRTRTRLAMLRPREGRFSLDMLRFGDELVEAKEIELPAVTKAAKKATSREQQLAKHLVDQMAAHFDPHKHPDEYRAAVTAAVEQKVEAHEIAEEQETEETRAAARGGKVIDLAEMLRRSLGGPKEREAKAERGKPAKPVRAAAPRREAAETRRGPKKAAARAHPAKRQRAAG